MSFAREPGNVLYCGWDNFRRRGAAPPVAGLYGLASRDCRLVGTHVGELDRTRRRWYPSYLGIGIRSARRTLKMRRRSAGRDESP